MQQRAFSLIELMVVIALATLVGMWAAPSLEPTLRDARLRGQTDELLAFAARARMEAISNPSNRITLCPATNLTASAECADSDAWESGAVMFNDLDGDRRLDAGSDRVIRLMPALSGGNTLRAQGFTSSQSLVFNSEGMVATAGTWTLCDVRGNSKARAVVVSVAGQPRLAVDENGDGIVDGHTGESVTCP